MVIDNNVIRQLIDKTNTSDIKIYDYNTIKIKTADKTIKRVISKVFSGKNDYLGFVDRLVMNTDYIKTFPVVRFTERYNTDYIIKTSICWISGDQPVVHIRKLKVLQSAG